MSKWKQFKYTKDPDKILAKIKGRRYKEYRKKWNISSRALLVQEYPIHLDFELHYGCNLKCPQCILQVDKSRLKKIHPYHIAKRKERINLEKFKEIIDEGIQHGLCSITLGVNNEPLMDPNIVQFIRYASKKGVMDIIILTNATLLTRRLSKELLESGLTKLYFSIDATKEATYQKIRKGGSLKAVKKNIHYFLELKKEKKSLFPITRVSFVKSKVNEKEEKVFIKYWRKRVDFVSVQAFTSPDKSDEDTFKAYHIENKSLKSLGNCPQPFQRLTIYHDGSVHPCCHWYGATLIVGNIHKDSIYNIWNSEKMRKIRSSVNDQIAMPKDCQICREVVFGKNIV
ncbi:MAG: radical SAM protein [Candidatus Omnitrophica bacterium]|nr:radical SAM protein [Candidatus Omnitrophota bacterium]